MTSPDARDDQHDEGTALLESALGDSVDVLADVVLMDVIEIVLAARRHTGDD